MKIRFLSRPKKQTPRPKKQTRAGKQIAADTPFERVDTECHHIVRLEKTAKAVPGWKVNLKRRGKYMHKYFSDRSYGGSAKALKAAKACREAIQAASSG